MLPALGHSGPEVRSLYSVVLLMTRLVYWLEPSRRARRTTPLVNSPSTPCISVYAGSAEHGESPGQIFTFQRYEIF